MKKYFFPLLFIVLAGCSKTLIELPSTDGKYAILVNQHFGIAQRGQDIILKDISKQTELFLTNLGDGKDWVDSVQWSGDGKLAGVMVSSRIILVINAAKQKIVHKFYFEKGTNYPPSAYISSYGFIEDSAFYYNVTADSNIIRLEGKLPE